MLNFYEKVYQIVKLIPAGKVTTYGEIARALSMPHHARAVGYALHKNPYQNIVPCHRVVFADGSLSPAFAFGGKLEQLNLLLNEGVSFDGDKVDMKTCCVYFSKSLQNFTNKAGND